MKTQSNDSENTSISVEDDIQTDEPKPDGRYSGNPGYVDGEPLRVGRLWMNGPSNDPNTSYVFSGSFYILIY